MDAATGVRRADPGVPAAAGHSRDRQRRDPAARRDLVDGLAATLPGLLEEFQTYLLERATTYRDENTHTVENWDAFATAVATGWAAALHCGDPACEDDIKAVTAATPRCIPLARPEHTGQCVRCDRPAAYGKRVLFGRAY